jgi:high affinity Mn2+ porin
MKKIYYIAQFSVLLSMLQLPATKAIAQDAKDTTTKAPRFNFHFQATYIYQYKPAFHAPYSGTNSLQPGEDKENSITSTLFFGVRLWKGAEIYINPEVAGGSGLSGAYGLGASTNGETFRVGDPAPTLYLARGYFAQTFQLGPKGTTNIAEGANELGGNKPTNYLRLQIGKMSLGDIFDNNAYANSPRNQFMNWCLMNNGAWDYAANLRGYTYAAAAILQHGEMTYKAALATMPTVANGADLNTNLNEEYSINAEVDNTFKINDRPGNARFLAYYNNGDMGSYTKALEMTGTPNVILTRQYDRTKTGFGVSADQQISDMAGVFLRGGWNDGNNETWAFTEVDRELSAGLSLTGDKWQRKNDNIGIAVDVNGLSKPHREYLAAGGLGFQLGDGKLNYSNESVLEVYYSYRPDALKGLWLTADYQCVVNPGYNADRGPVNVFSFRVHTEL